MLNYPEAARYFSIARRVIEQVFSPNHHMYQAILAQVAEANEKVLGAKEEEKEQPPSQQPSKPSSDRAKPKPVKAVKEAKAPEEKKRVESKPKLQRPMSSKPKMAVSKQKQTEKPSSRGISPLVRPDSRRNPSVSKLSGPKIQPKPILKKEVAHMSSRGILKPKERVSEEKVKHSEVRMRNGIVNVLSPPSHNVVSSSARAHSERPKR
mmetsp:Transcript_10211/g.17193  ORF Transcript_10211/g.17193 Transcript_10211/m.17193 type:complete len:208 (+) Transcript_10211:603-1226(+)